LVRLRLNLHQGRDVHDLGQLLDRAVVADVVAVPVGGTQHRPPAEDDLPPGVSQAVVVATGVTADGRREVLGFADGDSEDGAFRTAFLRSLKPAAWRMSSW
jgi:hypothetical protein